MLKFTLKWSKDVVNFRGGQGMVTKYGVPGGYP